jgi:hypothetical protein
MPPRKKRRKQQSSPVVMYVLLSSGLIVLLGLLGVGLWLLVSNLGAKWYPFELASGGFVVELPGPVSKKDSRDFNGPFGSAVAHFAQCDYSSDEVYLVMGADLPDLRFKSTDVGTILQDAVNGMLRNAPSGQLRENTDIKLEEFPGKEVVIEVPPHGMAVCRMYLIGRRLVGLLVAGKEVRPGAGRVQHFLGSLRITDSRLAEQARQDLAVMPRVGKDAAGRRVFEYTGGPVPPAGDLPGLVLYLPFDQPGPGDQVLDAVTGQPAARLAGAAGYGPGVRGKGLDLTAKGGYLDLGPAGDRLSFKANAPFTIAFWVRTAAHSSDGMLLSLRTAKDPGGLLQIGWAGTGFLRPLLINDAGKDLERAEIAGPQLKVPSWNHVALTRKPDGELTLFLNGEAVGTGPRQPGAVTTGRRFLGANAHEVAQGFTTNTFVGELDEFCVFDRALSPEEVRKLAGQP